MYFIKLVSNLNPTVLFIFEHHRAWLFHQSPKVFRFFLLPLLHRFNWENFTYFLLKVLLCLRAYKQALYFSDVSGCESVTWPCNIVCVFSPEALNGLLWCPPHIPSLNPSWIFDLHTMQQFTSGSELDGIH